MRQQSYLVRKGARYHFRRRIRHQATSRPISISLGTADPEKARCLARRLAVKWDEVEMTIETVAQRQNLTVDEQRAIYRAALEKVIGVAIGDLVAPKKYRGDEPGMERVMAGYYAALLQVQADAEDVPDEIIDAAMSDEWTEEERDLVRKMLAAFGIPDEARASAGEAALKEIGAPISQSTIHEARANVLRGMMEAHKRAELFNHPLIAAVGDPFAALLDDSLVLEARRTQLAQVGQQVTPTAPAAGLVAESSIFLNPSEKRFSEIIGPTLQALKAKHKWKGDLRQRTAIAERFAWVTGDKPLCEYTDADIQAYVGALRLIPNDIRYGRLGKSGRLRIAEVDRREQLVAAQESAVAKDRIAAEALLNSAATRIAEAEAAEAAVPKLTAQLTQTRSEIETANADLERVRSKVEAEKTAEVAARNSAAAAERQRDAARADAEEAHLDAGAARAEADAARSQAMAENAVLTQIEADRSAREAEKARLIGEVRMLRSEKEGFHQEKRAIENERAALDHEKAIHETSVKLVTSIFSDDRYARMDGVTLEVFPTMKMTGEPEYTLEVDALAPWLPGMVNAYKQMKDEECACSSLRNKLNDRYASLAREYPEKAQDWQASRAADKAAINAMWPNPGQGGGIGG